MQTDAFECAPTSEVTGNSNNGTPPDKTEITLLANFKNNMAAQMNSLVEIVKDNKQKNFAIATILQNANVNQ
jgi:hypothetical protein